MSVLFPRYRTYLLEVAGFVCLMLATMIELAHLASPAWKKMFLYDGSSLTLPLLMQAIFSQEPFIWVASAQSMFFPEFFLYALCYFLMPTVQAALVLNALVNFALFYLGVRLIFSHFSQLSRLKAIGVSCLVCFLILGLMLLEEEHYGAVPLASFYLFNTYYSGVILTGLYLLYATLSLVSLSTVSRKTLLLYILLPALVVALTVFSNPMFLVQIMAPLVATLGSLCLFGYLSRRQVLLCLSGPLAASLIGFCARFFFVDFMGQTVGEHLNFKRFYASVHSLQDFVLQNLAHPRGCLFLLVLGFASFFVLKYCFSWIRSEKPKSSPEIASIILAAFILWQILSCLAAFTLGGKVMMRYYLPLSLFPVLGLWPLFSKFLDKKLQTVSLMLLIVCLGSWAIFRINPLLTIRDLPGLACINKTLAGRKENGIAHYWTARALNVYGKNHQPLLQSDIFFEFYPWQTNLAAYANKNVNFIIVDGSPQDSRGERLPAGYVSLFIGQPSEIISCAPLSIYYFKTSSSGYQALNNKLYQSYQRLIRLREQHQLSHFFALKHERLNLA